MDYKFKVTGQYLKRLDDNVLITSSRNEFYAVFVFDKSWYGIEPKTANFQKADTIISVTLENNSCPIPWEVMTTSGEIKITIAGGDFVPTNSVSVNVVGEALTEGLAPTKASPSVYSYIVDTAEKINNEHSQVMDIMDTYNQTIEANKSQISETINTANETIAENVTKTQEFSAKAESYALKAEDTVTSVKKDMENMQISNVDIDRFFALNADSKIYESIFYNYDYNSTSTGEKAQDNAELVCEPSTDTIKARDDYEDRLLFRHWDVNAYIDENGVKHITAIEGDDKFDRYNSDVYVMYPTWYVKKTTYDNKWGIAVTGKPKEGFTPLGCGINADGTVSPYMLFAKYTMSSDLKSVSNAVALRNLSYNTTINNIKNKTGYSFTTENDIQFLQILFLIKYAELNFRKIMTGCVKYDYQYMCSVAESNVKRCIINKTEAQNLVVGSYVMIGDMGSNTAKARNNEYMYNIADTVKITSIEEYDSENSAVNIECDSEFTTTATTAISTAIWKTGSTDCVLGSDGSPWDNTSGIYPCKLGGIEIMLGSDEISSAVMKNTVTGGQAEILFYVNTNVSKLSTSIDEGYAEVPGSIVTSKVSDYISAMDINMEYGINKPSALSGTSLTGFSSPLYIFLSNGFKPFKHFGSLSTGGAITGLWYMSGRQLSLFEVGWANTTRISVNIGRVNNESN